MSKKILIIESDSAFAGELATALEGKGFAVRVSGDGKEGLELARVDRPDAIVLCVELPKMSGYSICNKLKKDDALRTVPLVITSSEATPETFEQHRKLKTRAEDYLIKPFGGAALVERLGGRARRPGQGRLPARRGGPPGRGRGPEAPRQRLRGHLPRAGGDHGERGR
jgi:DNA-binding response OmpR family regulator